MVEILENPENSKGRNESSSKTMEEIETKLPDPLALHQSDTPGITLVNTPLDGHNYGQ